MCVNAFSVRAMNGTSYGTSNSGNPRFSASSTSAGGTVAWLKPVPKPRPASWWPASRSRYSRTWSSSVSCRPVLRSSSPPESHGVGSTSSEMCTQRTGRASPAAPAWGLTSRSRMRSRSVSTSLPELGRIRRLLQPRPQHGVHLLELLGPGDQRRRELHDGVAAVVGAADQAAGEQLGRQEAAQQPLRLLRAEVRLRGLVADQLDGPEVAHAAHVADDRDV